jgi:hypothetical protein
VIVEFYPPPVGCCRATNKTEKGIIMTGENKINEKKPLQNTAPAFPAFQT